MYRYNAYGKVTSECDEQGRMTRYEYLDDLHLVSRRINPDGSQLRYRYENARLLLSEIENERGERYRLDYHGNGLISQETGFDGRRTAYRYDLKGQLLEKPSTATTAANCAPPTSATVPGACWRRHCPTAIGSTTATIRSDAWSPSTTAPGRWPTNTTYGTAWSREHQAGPPFTTPTTPSAS